MKLTRSACLFTVGVIGVCAETVYSLRFHQTPDPTLLIIFAAMMGLPVYLSQDSKGDNERRSRDLEKRHQGDDDPDSSARPHDNSPTR